MNYKVLKSMSDFMKKALKYLKSSGTSESIGQIVKDEYVFNEDDSFKRSDILYPTFSQFLFKQQVQIMDMQEASDTTSILYSEHITPRTKHFNYDGEDAQTPTFEEASVVIKHEIILFLRDYIETYQTLDFIEERFIELYSRYENSWLKSTFRMDYYVPLVGFDTEVSPISLSSNPPISIVKFTVGDKNRIWKQINIGSGINVHDFASCKYALYSTCNLYRGAVTRFPDEIRNHFEKCMESLRLFKAGDVGDVAIIAIVDPQDITIKFRAIPMRGLFSLPEVGGRFGYIVNETYVLKTSELKQLKDIFETVINNPIDEFQLGIRRMNLAYSRELVEDKFIDVCIALDSVLTYGLDRSGRDIFAKHGSQLLCSTSNRDYLYNKLVDIYLIRSKLVHEGLTLQEVIKKYEYDIKVYTRYNDVYPFTIQIAREIFLEYITQYLPKKTQTYTLTNFNGDLKTAYMSQP